MASFFRTLGGSRGSLFWHRGAWSTVVYANALPAAVALPPDEEPPDDGPPGIVAAAPFDPRSMRMRTMRITRSRRR
jgi:hypothetical protein